MAFQQIKRLFQDPKQSFFRTKGTGKSTFFRSCYPDALVIDLLVSDTRNRYTAHPENLLDVVRAQPEGKVIVIDEIQKVPQLLSNIHVLIEEKKEWMFVLTGSSARKLKKEGVDFLGVGLSKKCYTLSWHVSWARNLNSKRL